MSKNERCLEEITDSVRKNATAAVMRWKKKRREIKQERRFRRKNGLRLNRV